MEENFFLELFSSYSFYIPSYQDIKEMNIVEGKHQMIKDTDIKVAHIILGQGYPAHTLQGSMVSYYFLLNNCSLERRKVISTK